MEIDEIMRILHLSFDDLLAITKSMANENRLVVLRELLQHPRDYDHLQKTTKLGKTALSNHLNQLLESELIVKIEHGKYKITDDGSIFIEALVIAFKKTKRWQATRLESIERKGPSKEFMSQLFGTERD